MNLWRYECSLNTPQTDIFRHYYTYCKEWKKKCINKFSYCIDSTIVLPLYMLGLGGGMDLNLLDSRACYKITKIPPTPHLQKKYTLGPRTWYKLYFTEPELNMYIHYSHVVFFCKVHAYRERHYDGVLYLLLKEKWNE